MNEKITFSDIVDKIAEETGAPKQIIHDLLIETATISKEGLARDGVVNLGGFGKFQLRWHEARPGRNPQTGEEITIPAHNTIHFKPEISLREYINRKYAHLKPTILKEKVDTVEPKEDLAESEENPVETEETATPTGAETTTPVREKERKQAAGWLWFIIPLLIIILVFLLWPSKKASDTDKEPVVSEKIHEETPKDEASAVDTTPAVSEKTKEGIQTESEKEEITAEESVAEIIKIETPGGTHTVKKGDNLWKLSDTYYHQPYLWPNIYRVNQNKIDDPDFISPKATIIVPSLEGKAGRLSQKDKNEIAEGFIKVYLYYKDSNKRKAPYYLWVVKNLDENGTLHKYQDQIDKTDLDRINKIERELPIK